MSVVATASFTPGVQIPNSSDPNLAGTFPGPASYDQAGGGEDMDWALAHGFNAPPNIAHADAISMSGLHTGSYDPIGNKWRFFVTATGAEAANLANLSAEVFKYRALRSA